MNPAAISIQYNGNMQNEPFENLLFYIKIINKAVICEL